MQDKHYFISQRLGRSEQHTLIVPINCAGAIIVVIVQNKYIRIEYSCSLFPVAYCFIIPFLSDCLIIKARAFWATVYSYIMHK